MDNLLSDDGQIDAQQLLALYSVKFLVTAIQNSNTFFGRYCGVEDSAIAALTVAPYYMWVAERTICATLGVSEVEKIEYAFTKAIKLFGQKEDTANAIVKEYLETFALDHAKSQITNVSFRESIIFLMISSINGRMVSSKLDEEINTTIIEHVDSCYNNVVLNSDELGKHISNA